jgi:hypothetical protein
VEIDADVAFSGSRYKHDVNNQNLGRKTGKTLSLAVPAYAIEFWTEEV